MDTCKKLILCLWFSCTIVENRTDYSGKEKFKSFLDELSLQDIPIATMPEGDVSKLNSDNLRGLYSQLRDIPELMFRRFQIGAIPPNIDLDKVNYMKRSELDLVHAEPVCAFKTEWQLIRRAKDINDNDVIVYQPSNETTSRNYQWFYTITCDRASELNDNLSCPGCCKGINNQRYASSCMPKKSYIMAFVRRPSQSTFDWNWIQIDSGCSCAISPRYY